MSSNTTVVWTGAWVEFVDWTARHNLRRSGVGGYFTDADGGRYVAVSTRGGAGGWTRLRGLDLRGADLACYGSWEDGDGQDVQGIAEFLYVAGVQGLKGVASHWVVK